jgi:hypothetical protein
VLTPERQSVPAIYEQLRWEHKDLEDVITTHWDDLPRAGIQLHVATKDVASGPRWKYIEVDGKRYSAISLDAPERTRSKQR